MFLSRQLVLFNVIIRFIDKFSIIAAPSYFDECLYLSLKDYEVRWTAQHPNTQYDLYAAIHLPHDLVYPILKLFHKILDTGQKKPWHKIQIYPSFAAVLSTQTLVTSLRKCSLVVQTMTTYWVETSETRAFCEIPRYTFTVFSKMEKHIYNFVVYCFKHFQNTCFRRQYCNLATSLTFWDVNL